MITPSQALWILHNLPQKPYSSSIMPSLWLNSRRQIVEELQAIIDAEQPLVPDASQESAKMIESINDTIGHLINIGAIQRR